MEKTNKNSITRVSDVITESEIRKWKSGDVVTISAGCGAGKSYFIKNILYEWAKSENMKILMLIHRSKPVEQFRAELERDKKINTIDVRTYQSVEAILKKDEYFDYDKYKFIVCDEFHFFISDSKFNNNTDLSFYSILENKSAIKIFMSATSDEMQRVLNKTLKQKRVRIWEYSIPITFKHIKTLTFYHNDNAVTALMKKWVENGDKAIIFLNNCDTAYKIYCQNKKNSLFLCSKSNPNYRYVNQKKIEEMLINERFDENFLICTSCFDAGANIIDEKLTKIVIDIRDFDSFIQCLGRKRVQHDDDKIDVYVKVCSNRQISGELQQTKQALERAEYLINTSPQEYVKKYGREPDRNTIVYDYARINKHANSTTVKINYLMYYKRKFDILRFTEILSFGKYGYCKYIASHLGFYDSELDKSYYKIICEDYTLETYLNSMIGKIMYTKTDRKELIDKLDVRSNGKQLKSLNSLNYALKEWGLNYIIVEFSTSKIINGEKKKYKSAWKIISIE